MSAKEITSLLRQNNIRGYSKLKKAEKIALLIKNNIPVPVMVRAPRQQKQYGVVGGKVKPYTEKEQEQFIKAEVDVNPLIQKQLDPIKNKKAYELKIEYILTPHQKDFVLHFITNFTMGGLLFHSVGSGKTLTAVAFAHYYLAIFPTNNVCIISPPALLFNFVDTAASFGLDIRDKRFKYVTYNVFSKNPDDYANDKTLLILDETHLMRTKIKNDGDLDNPNVTKGKIPFGVLLGAINAHKILCMTGTPFINELYDIENIMAYINQREPYGDEVFKEILNTTENKHDYFNYKISYFNIMETPSAIYFPKVNDRYIPFLLTGADYESYKTVAQGGEIFEFINSSVQPLKYKNKYVQLAYDSQNPYKKAVKTKQLKEDKKALIKATLTDEKQKETFEKKFLELQQLKEEQNQELKEHRLRAFYNGARLYGNIIGGLKIEFTLNKIKENRDYKTIIYSTFLNILYFIANELKALKIGYRMITGDESTMSKNKSKNDFNNDDNVQVLLISKAGTEGVDCKNVRQFFLMESQWNNATEEQAIARAIRFKSHLSLPEDQRFVNIYRLIICVNDKDKDFVENMETKIEQIQTLAEKRNDELKIFSKLYTNIKGAMKLPHFFKELKNIYAIEKTKYIERLYDNWKRARPGMGQTKQPFNEPNQRQIFNNFIYHTNKKEFLKEYFNGEIDTQEQFTEEAKRMREVTSVQDFNGVGIDWTPEYTENFKKAEEYMKEIKKNIDIFDTYIVATQEARNETKYDETYSSLSADIQLKLMCIRKTAEIYPLVKELKEHQIKAIEDIQTTAYGDFVKEFKNIETGENVKDLIKKQQQIINESNDALIESKELSNVIALAGERESQILRNKREDLRDRKQGKEGAQEFFTPPEIAEELINYSTGMYETKGVINILEPTAGAGALCHAIIKNMGLRNITNYKLYMCEFQEYNRRLLALLKTGNVELVESKDFLNYLPDERYNLIFMNPPFHLKKALSGLNRDYWAFDFVERAYTFLKEGGSIYVIGPINMFSRDKKYEAWTEKEDKRVDVLKTYDKYKWVCQDNSVIYLNFTMWRIQKIVDLASEEDITSLLLKYIKDETAIDTEIDVRLGDEKEQYIKAKNRQNYNSYLLSIEDWNKNPKTNLFKKNDLLINKITYINAIKGSEKDLRLQKEMLKNPPEDLQDFSDIKSSTKINDAYVNVGSKIEENIKLKKNEEDIMKKRQLDFTLDLDTFRANSFLPQKKYRQTITEVEKRKLLSNFILKEKEYEPFIREFYDIIDNIETLKDILSDEREGKYYAQLNKYFEKFETETKTMGIGAEFKADKDDYLYLAKLQGPVGIYPAYTEKLNNELKSLNNLIMTIKQNKLKMIRPSMQKLFIESINKIEQNINNLLRNENKDIKTSREYNKLLKNSTEFTAKEYKQLNNKQNRVNILRTKGQLAIITAKEIEELKNLKIQIKELEKKRDNDTGNETNNMFNDFISSLDLDNQNNNLF
jgi:hypothetical protein